MFQLHADVLSGQSLVSMCSQFAATISEYLAVKVFSIELNVAK